jgi:DNA mismatch repair ATPase MutS
LLAAAVAPRVLAHTPESPVLAGLRDELAAWVSGRAGSRLRTLRRALRFLHLHETGALYPVLEMATSWELNALFVLEAGIKHDGATWERVAGALGDLEALCALAVDADERAPGPWPEILSGPPALEIEQGVHPLLQGRGAVPNDARLGGATRLALVTGSNMAGKSTFLRMTALQVVLAQLGSPVRARSMRLSPLRLRSLIHVRDSLADGKSYFLVEVERVLELIRLTGQEAHVFVVVDELFRGTNSVERVAASRAIARHWAASRALFLLATHDLDLARLADPQDVPGTTAWHFPDEIQDGALRFPYRLQPGWSNTHNALRLLELAGYPPAIVQEARGEAAERWAQSGEIDPGRRNTDA